ncbi:MAG: DUF72 domain-containing protein [Gemmatimonadaceae bacterium]
MSPHAASDAPSPGLDAAHDPGVDAARERAEVALAGAPRAARLRTETGHEVRIGTAGWTDPTLTAAGVFYPPSATTPEARLRFYAERFPTVEVDAPYYALPSARNAALWAERTPADFVFDIKAHALMTGHPTEVARLPRALRNALPADVAGKKRVYPKDLPGDVYDEVWTTFRAALEPLTTAGKMGAVLLQYPPWFMPGSASRDAILEARDRLGGLLAAVELRDRRWFAPKTAERTLRFLADHAIPYVIVDEPQGLRSSVPPVPAVTSPELAIVRLHGRRGDTWAKRGASVAEKYRYLYDRAELETIAPMVVGVADQTARTRVVFNNCYGNYGTTNAMEMTAMLAGPSLAEG